jgi:hypothetical protein
MNKKYVKPAMAIETIELENMIASSPGVFTGESYNPGGTNLTNRRGGYEEEEIWEESTDLWGNSTWTRVD